MLSILDARPELLYSTTGASWTIASRSHDQAGVGFCHVGISNGFRNFVNGAPELLDLFPSGEIRDETGFEAFYNFGLTPAAQVALDVQYLIDPLLGTDDSLVLGGRVQLNF